jgi:UPF0148 protein
MCFSQRFVFYTREQAGNGSMCRAGKENMRVAAELVAKGATMLGEPCPQCGGIQVRYRGRVYCTSHEDLSSVVVSEALSVETVSARLREVLLAKLNEAASSLGAEEDRAKQDQIVSLMAKCFELLQKLPQK